MRRPDRLGFPYSSSTTVARSLVTRILQGVAIAAISCATPDTELLPSPPAPLSPVVSCAEAARAPGRSIDADVPTLPVGIDAYARWETDWPSLRLGTRTYMRSTYERGGDNYDSSHFLRKRVSSRPGEAPGDRYVGLDVAGSGVLTFVRANHWHGSPWHWIVDGEDVVIGESSTATPDKPVTPSVWLPESAFAAPFAVTWTTTKGADLSWVPIPFSSSLSIEYERTHYGTGYWIYSVYPERATNLSRQPCTWDVTATSPVTADLRSRFSMAAEEVAKELAASTAKGVVVERGVVHANAGAVARVHRVDAPPGRTSPTTLRALSFEVDASDAEAFGKATLRMTWDDRARPSVDAPVQLFFGTGSLFNRDDREWLVRAFPVSVHFLPKAPSPAKARVRFTTILPMPFMRSASVDLAFATPLQGNIDWEIASSANTHSAFKPNWIGYLHATYHDFPSPIPGKDNVLLDTTVDEGGGDVCGSFIGTSFTFSDRADLATLEGDPRFFFDDSGTPQGQGTGTEEWGGGGDYWEGGQTMTLPFAGHPVGAPYGATPKNAEDAIESAYRFLLGDAMPFGKNARIRLEHGGVNQSTEHYRSVTYWYGLPGACLSLTDTIHPGNASEERAHEWSVLGATEQAVLTSRYEEGVDHDARGVETYPEIADSGVTIHTRATFRLSIPADNVGILLRRRLDYAIADQRAVVSIADGDVPLDRATFVRAGVWYTAGSTSVTFADAPTELGRADEVTAISPHRWRDEELLLPRALTEGRRSIRVRVDVVPQPGARGWSVYRLWSYAYRLPPSP